MHWSLAAAWIEKIVSLLANQIWRANFSDAMVIWLYGFMVIIYIYIYKNTYHLCTYIYICPIQHVHMYAPICVYIYMCVRCVNWDSLSLSKYPSLVTVKQQIQMLQCYNSCVCWKIFLPPASTGAHASKHIRHVSIKWKDLGQSSPSKAPNAQHNGIWRNTQASK